MDNSSSKKTDDGQGKNHELQQQQQRSSNLKAPKERPYRRRIKPPPAKVHHVHPAHFRRFVQRRTCCVMLPQQQPNTLPLPGSISDDATASTSSATENHPQQPADAAVGVGDSAATDAGCLDVSRKSMQEAYMAWCSSNDIPLSPGTMAELSFTEHHQS